MIRRYKGKTKYMHVPVTESCIFIKGGLVRWYSGKVAPVPGSVGTQGVGTAEDVGNSVILGVIRHDVLSTDDDYADSRNVEVEVPVEENVEWEVDFVDSVVAADVGLYVDLYDASTGIRANSTYDHLKIVKRISASKAICILQAGKILTS